MKKELKPILSGLIPTTDTIIKNIAAGDVFVAYVAPVGTQKKIIDIIVKIDRGSSNDDGKEIVTFA